MRGAFLVITVITMLIVGFLVMKNIGTDPVEEASQIETIQKAKDAAKETEDKLKEKINEINKTIP